MSGWGTRSAVGLAFCFPPGQPLKRSVRYRRCARSLARPKSTWLGINPNSFGDENDVYLLTSRRKGSGSSVYFRPARSGLGAFAACHRQHARRASHAWLVNCGPDHSLGFRTSGRRSQGRRPWGGLVSRTSRPRVPRASGPQTRKIAFGNPARLRIDSVRKKSAGFVGISFDAEVERL